MSVYNRRLSVRVIPESPIYKIRGKNNLTVLESYASSTAVDELGKYRLFLLYKLVADLSDTLI